MTLSRRQWILGLPVVAFGARIAAAPQGLDQFMTNAGPPCAPDEQVTPSVAADATYRAGAPLRSALAPAGAAGTPLAFSGSVTGVTCGRIKGATVDVWQADARGMYDMKGFAFRGRQVTDAEGRFHFDTVVPGYAGARARRLGIHVVVPGKADFWTAAFFPDDPRAASDPAFKKGLLLKKVQAPRGGEAVVFDVVLKL
jgi:protocatechuate 3,4-dioxygenase beta subunit